jgi:diaminopimelate decarboxylase
MRKALEKFEMTKNRDNESEDYSRWGLTCNVHGELYIGGCNTLDLGANYGTPLHVVDENRLKETAGNFLECLKSVYPGDATVHFALKCNAVPGVVSIIRESGLKAEVMSEFELNLAMHLGYPGIDIIVNGPFKPDRLLKTCLDYGIRFIIIDSLLELRNLDHLCESAGKSAEVLLRINPDYIPQGMNQGSATGSRKGCAFGLDLKGGEVEAALNEISGLRRVNFRGFHFHIGTGIHNPEDYCKALISLRETVNQARILKHHIEVFDVGGGFATATSRGMTTREMLLYEAFDRLPPAGRTHSHVGIQEFAEAITRGMKKLFGKENLPELIVEPGRCIASSNQLLLLQVHQVKERPGLKKWLITDGGIGTVTMPTYYEYHEVLLCNDINRTRKENVTITGPACFAGDIVYRNKTMPQVYPGEILAIMDSGAYFTAWESSFGFARPAIVAASNGKHRLLRRREEFSDMIARDNINKSKCTITN